MPIREASADDKVRVIELLRDSRVGAGFDRRDGPTGFVFPADPAYGARLFDHHTSDKNSVCFVHDVDGIAQGVLMAVAFEHPYGPVRLSKDTIWWIDPAHRGGTAAVRMLDALEKWSTERGCKFSGVAGMGEDPNISNLLKRRGYKPIEVHFLKAI